MANKLPNEDGRPYDYGDPEFWEYFGIYSKVALAFAQGFPEYWQDAAPWHRSPDEIAAIKRRNTFSGLSDTPPCRTPITHVHIKPFVQNPASDEELAERHASALEIARQSKDTNYRSLNPVARRLLLAKSSGEPLHYNPFAYANKFGAKPTLELWNSIARCIIESLKDASIPKKSLPHGFKQRERLPDGTVFCGRTRLAQQDILKIAKGAGPGFGVRWGPMWYSMNDARKSHFLVMGTTRSGKTTLIRLFLQSTFLNPDVRCIVYDFKGELLPLLNPSPKRKMATHYYHLFNPFDTRGVAWDVAKDVDQQSASTLSAILIPDEQRGRRDYFLQTSRQVLAAVIRTLIEMADDRWTFLDLMLAIQRDNIRSVLSATTEGRRNYDAHIQGDGQTQQNVLSELDRCSQRYLSVASAWSKAKEKLSLSRWAETESKGIVIGNSLRNHEDLQPINQAILYFLFHELLDNTRPRKCHTFMILDEFTRLGRLPVIEHVQEAAPGQGLSLALGIHDVSTLTDIYGKSANGILGACGFRAYLRVQSAETARWMSDQIGAQDILVEHTSTSESESESPGQGKEDPLRRSTGSSSTKTYNRSTRPAVPPEEFMQLPLASADDYGLAGYYQVPMHPPYRGRISRDVYDSYERFSSPEQLEERLWATTDRDFRVADKTIHFKEKEIYPTPVENFRPPEDSFSTLASLGFEPDESPHSRPLPKQAVPVAKPIQDLSKTAPPATAETKENTTPESPPRQYNLSKMVWDDDLDNFRLMTEDD